MSNNFNTNEYRDAWKTIRGFVYQVNLTIDRWLNLKHDEALELERGEDIDIIHDDFHHRELQQIKYREKKITINSLEVIESIISFFEHKKKNPDLFISFRFITTAEITLERNFDKSLNKPALVLWQQLINDEIEDKNLIVSYLRKFLKKFEKPERIKEDIWNSWNKFINDSDENIVLEFLLGIEWSTGSFGNEDLSQLIKERISIAFKKDLAQAEIIYHKLFFYVFKVLAISGLKQLTISSLVEQSQIVSIDKSEKEIFEFLQKVLYNLEMRIDLIEEKIEKNKNDMIVRIDSLENSLKEMVIGYESYVLNPNPTIEEPDLVENVSLRDDSVNRLWMFLKDKTFLYLWATFGSGKTQLALLISKKSEKEHLWFRFGYDKQLDEALILFRSNFFANFNVSVPEKDFEEFFIGVLSSNENKDLLIILDDLPKITDRDSFSILITKFIKACSKVGTKIIATSIFDFPANFKDDLKNISLFEEAPLLTKTEIQEILKKSSPNLEINISTFIDLAESVTGGLPILLSTLINYMNSKNWQIDQKEIIDLFTHQYAQNKKNEYSDIFIKTVKNVEIRELLYRLDLIIGNFTDSEVEVISNVSPPVHYPQEKLKSLINIWIQKDKTQYNIFPLIKNLGKENLSQKVKIEVNMALADHIFKKKIKTYPDAKICMTYYLVANDFGKAATILINIYSSILRDNKVKDDLGIGQFWVSTPFPENMEHYLKLMVRAHQILIFEQKLNKDSTNLVKELDLLIKETDIKNEKELLGLKAALMLLGVFRRKNGFKYLKKLIELGNKIKLSNNPMKSFGLNFEMTIWFNNGKIQSLEDLLDWLSVFEILTPKQINLVMKDNVEKDFSMQIIDVLWNKESKKLKEEQNWNQVIEDYFQIYKKVKALNIEKLIACTLRAQVVVLAEYMNRFDEAIDLAKYNINQNPDKQIIQYLLKDIIGRQYYYKNKLIDAKNYLSEAFDLNTNIYALNQVFSILYLCELYSHDPTMCLKFIEKGIEETKESFYVPEAFLIKLLGEKTIALWKLKGLREAFYSLEEAAELLLKPGSKFDIDKITRERLTVLIGLICGYFINICYFGNIPIKGTFKPIQGMFNKNFNIFPIAYDLTSKPKIVTTISLLAGVVGDFELSKKWSEISITVSKRYKDYVSYLSAAMNKLSILVIEEKYIEARNFAFELEKSLVNMRQYFGTNKEVSLENDLNIMIFYFLTMIFLVLARKYLNSKESFNNTFLEVTLVLEGVNSKSVFKNTYIIACQCFKDIFSNKFSSKELRKKSVYNFQKGNLAMSSICSLGSILQKDITNENALKNLVEFDEYMSSYISVFSPNLYYVFEPFLLEFWKEKFNFDDNKVKKLDLISNYYTDTPFLKLGSNFIMAEITNFLNKTNFSLYDNFVGLERKKEIKNDN